MVGYNSKTSKKYCDLNCYYCEGWALKECLMTNDGNHMRLLRCICMGEGRVILDNLARPSTYWYDHTVLTPEIIGTLEFPCYLMEKEN